MKSIKLQELVQDELNTRWSDFQAAHPQLARVLSQPVLMESVTQALSADPELQRTLAEAAGVGNGLQIMRNLVSQFVSVTLNIADRIK